MGATVAGERRTSGLEDPELDETFVLAASADGRSR
jgi:hypothetical protein